MSCERQFATEECGYNMYCLTEIPIEHTQPCIMVQKCNYSANRWLEK